MEKSPSSVWSAFCGLCEERYANKILSPIWLAVLRKNYIDLYRTEDLSDFGFLLEIFLSSFLFAHAICLYVLYCISVLLFSYIIFSVIIIIIILEMGILRHLVLEWQ